MGSEQPPYCLFWTTYVGISRNKFLYCCCLFYLIFQDEVESSNIGCAGRVAGGGPGKKISCIVWSLVLAWCRDNNKCKGLAARVATGGPPSHFWSLLSLGQRRAARWRSSGQVRQNTAESFPTTLGQARILLRWLENSKITRCTRCRKWYYIKLTIKSWVAGQMVQQE